MTGHEQHDALIWGVREAFLIYVRGVGGVIETADAAWPTDDDRFAFPLEAADADLLRFRGAVTVQAHGGLLDVRLRNPWVTIGQETGELTAELKGAAGRRTVADLRFAADGSAATARLHRDACFLFDFTYPPGTALDDLHFTPATWRQTQPGRQERPAPTPHQRRADADARPTEGIREDRGLLPSLAVPTAPGDIVDAPVFDAIRRIPFLG